MFVAFLHPVWHKIIMFKTRGRWPEYACCCTVSALMHWIMWAFFFRRILVFLCSENISLDYWITFLHVSESAYWHHPLRGSCKESSKQNKWKTLVESKVWPEGKILSKPLYLSVLVRPDVCLLKNVCVGIFESTDEESILLLLGVKPCLSCSLSWCVLKYYSWSFWE